MTQKDDISVERLKQLLSYDPETGIFIWKRRSLDMFKTSRHMNAWNARYANKVAGFSISTGHAGIRIFNSGYKAHRLAWAIYHGAWPNDQIDHINNNPSDNRICNLREANSLQNGYNKKNRLIGTSKYKGVSFHAKTGKWQSQVMFNGTVIYLGVFTRQEDAHAAYCKKAEELHGKFFKT